MAENMEKTNNYIVLKILIILITVVSSFCAGLFFQKVVKSVPGDIYGCGGTVDTPQRDYEECARLHEIANKQATEAKKFMEDYSHVFGVIGIVCLLANIIIFVIVRKEHINLKNIYTYFQGISFGASIFLSLAFF